MGKKLLIILAMLTCSSCSPNKETIYEYSDVKNFKINWNDIFLMSEEDYLLYFYSPKCGNCEELKCDVLKFFFERKPIMYFVEETSDFVFDSPASLTIGVNNINDFYISGTPSLVQMKNHSVYENLVGVKKIKKFII